ncbi:MAG: RNase adapter RapZ [Peptococcaceae bacterium]|nr:RNase adapter RapZ [Peptococcaceae bacterium]
MSKEELRLVVITGLSGAGKTQAMQSLEDQGYFCVDNLPPAFIVKFAELCAQSQGKVSKAAIVCDSRGGTFFESLSEALVNLKAAGFHFEILFLEASDEALIYRYKESRRRHPLSPQGRVLEGIYAERRQLEDLRGKAHKIINTTELAAAQLRRQVAELFSEENSLGRLNVSVVSFGYKYGIPLDADLLFDVRFLPNPFYVKDLRPLTGAHALVQQYVFEQEVTREFMQRLFSLLEYILPYYQKEGKTHLVAGVGCTGGQHRSVAIAERIGDFLKKKDYLFSVKHRDAVRNLKGVEGFE